jgi:4-hydroxy-tetrahydrodipicolinate synthase
MATPVLKNGNPDLPACARLARWLIGKGVGALFVCGTTGRFSHFTPEQNAGICRAVARAARGRVPVLAGIADSGFHRAAANAQSMKAAGADVLVATAPYYLRHTQQERERTLERLLDAAPLPVVIYNIPELVSPSLRWEWVLDAARHPRALGLKDSGNDWAWFQKVLARRPRGFALIQGKEPLLARSMLAGADGIVISLSHMDPAACVELCRAAWRGDRAAAERAQRRVQGFYDQMVRRMKRRLAMSTLMKLLEDGLRRQGASFRLLAPAEAAR